MSQINLILPDRIVDQIDIMIEFYKAERIEIPDLDTQFKQIVTTQGIAKAREWLKDVERAMRRARPRSRAAFVERCVEKFFEGEKDSPYSKELASLQALKDSTPATRKKLPARMKVTNEVRADV